MPYFEVTKEIDYVHRVKVVVEASSADEASQIVRNACSCGQIGEETSTTVVYDNFDQVDLGHPMEFEAKEVSAVPPVDASVHAVKRALLAESACRTLIEAYRDSESSGGSTDWSDVDVAHVMACEAMGVDPCASDDEEE